MYYSSLLKFKTNSCQKMFGPPQTNSKRMFKSPVNYGLVPTKSKGMFGRVPPDTHCKCTHSCAAILSYMLTEVNSSTLQYDQTLHGPPQLASATRDSHSAPAPSKITCPQDLTCWSVSSPARAATTTATTATRAVKKRSTRKASRKTKFLSRWTKRRLTARAAAFAVKAENAETRARRCLQTARNRATTGGDRLALAAKTCEQAMDAWRAASEAYALAANVSGEEAQDDRGCPEWWV